MNYLNQGVAAPWDALLAQREKRGQWLESCGAQFPCDALVCFKMNIPGPIKTNRLIELGFASGCQQIAAALGSVEILLESFSLTGPEMVLRTELDAQLAKAKMIHLEETSPLGRLFDIDVYRRGNAVTREELSQAARPCLICAKPAKICARSQTHPLNQLLDAIEVILLKDPAIMRELESVSPADPSLQTREADPSTTCP